MAGYVRQDVADTISVGSIIDSDALDGEFDQIEAAFNASTGHKHDGTASEGPPIEVIGPAQEYEADGTALFPKTDDTYDLGKSSFKFQTGYFGTSVVVPAVSATTSVTTPLVDADKFSATNDGSAAAPVFTFDGDSDTGMYTDEDNNLCFATGGVKRLTINEDGNLVVSNGSGLSSDGSLLEDLNADELSSGTVPDARISGAYTGITTLTIDTEAISQSFKVEGGSAASPGYKFNGDVNSGLYRSATNTIGLSTNGAARLVVTNSAVTAPSGVIFSGNGSGLTNLDASDLSNGTVPNSRINGSYTNFTDIETNTINSGGVTIKNLNSSYPSSGTAHIFRTSAGSPDGNTGDLVLQSDPSGDNNILFVNGSIPAKVGSVTEDGFVGGGRYLTDLDASELSYGTVPNARISGSYNNFTSITGSGDFNSNRNLVASGSDASPSYSFQGDSNTGMFSPGANQLAFTVAGSNRLRLQSGLVEVRNGWVFSGDGSGLTDLDASGITDNSDARDFVQAQIAKSDENEVGTYAFLTLTTDARIVWGNTYSGSDLKPAGIRQSGGAADVATDTGQTVSGTWRAMGGTPNSTDTEHTSLFVRIS